MKFEFKTIVFIIVLSTPRGKCCFWDSYMVSIATLNSWNEKLICNLECLSHCKQLIHLHWIKPQLHGLEKTPPYIDKNHNPFGFPIFNELLFPLFWMACNLITTYMWPLFIFISTQTFLMKRKWLGLLCDTSNGDENHNLVLLDDC